MVLLLRMTFFYFLPPLKDPNSKDHAGSSAIHKAAANGHLTCLQRLMEKGGDVSQEDAAGCTVLHVAARNGHIGEEVMFSNETYLSGDRASNCIFPKCCGVICISTFFELADKASI